MRKILLITAIGISLLIVIGLLALSRYNTTLITVKNESGFKIENVLVETRNNSVSLGSIANRDRKTVKLPNKFDESNIVLSFTMGNEKKRWEGGYVESHGGYHATLIVKPNGDVECNREIVFIDDFADDVTEARFVIEAEDYSSRTSTGKGSWWQVDGKDNKFIEGPKINEIASSLIGNVRNNYMMVLGTAIGNIEPTDTSYDGPFLDYKILIKKPGKYNLYLRWIGRDGSTDSAYVFLLKPDGSLLVDSGSNYFLFHGRTWEVYEDWVWDNIGLQNRITCAYAGRPDLASWYISEPGIYTIRIALREIETAVDALVFKTVESPLGPPQSRFEVRDKKESPRAPKVKEQFKYYFSRWFGLRNKYK